MKYNKSYENGDFEEYLQYLEAVRPRLPKDVFDFVSDPQRHDFSDKSLHDSWIKSITCSYNQAKDETTITLTLLSANADREYRLSFSGVSQYTILQQTAEMYRDLITFEVGLEELFETEKIAFRAMFSGEGAVFEVYSDSMHVEEKHLSSTT